MARICLTLGKRRVWKGVAHNVRKRRDSKNRILRSGKSQRKDGRYAYKYTDTFGKVQFDVVQIKLTPSMNRKEVEQKEKEGASNGTEAKEIREGE